MKIKDVAKITGLSSKAIRFYEEKGLITVSWNQSDYREYTKENIETLLQIKLLRKCGLSIQEIIDIKSKDESLDDMLYDVISKLDKQSLEISVQKELCLDVIKAKGQYTELYEVVDTLDSDTYQELVDTIIEESQISLGMQIMLSLPLLGPILCMFLFLSEKNYQNLTMAFIFSLIATVILTVSWSHFLKSYKFQKESFLEGIIHFGKLLLLMIFMLIGLCGFYILFDLIKTSFYMKDSVFVVSTPRIAMMLLLVVGLELCLLVVSFIGKKLDHQIFRQYNAIYPFFKKHIKVFAVINLVILYLSFFNFATVSQDTIVTYSPLQPWGDSHTFDQIEKVNTGFQGYGIPFVQDKGDFYYTIIFDDQKSISLQDCQTTDEYEKSTYSELVEVDRLIMQNHPEKISSDDYQEYVQLDKEYVDHFLSIIYNQNK